MANFDNNSYIQIYIPIYIYCTLTVNQKFNDLQKETETKLYRTFCNDKLSEQSSFDLYLQQICVVYALKEWPPVEWPFNSKLSIHRMCVLKQQQKTKPFHMKVQ